MMKKEFVFGEYAVNALTQKFQYHVLFDKWNTSSTYLVFKFSISIFSQKLKPDSSLYSHKMAWIDWQVRISRMYESIDNSVILPARFQVYIVKQNVSTLIQFNIRDLFIVENISIIHRCSSPEIFHDTNLVNSITSFSYCFSCSSGLTGAGIGQMIHSAA